MNDLAIEVAYAVRMPALHVITDTLGSLTPSRGMQIVYIDQQYLYLDGDRRAFVDLRAPVLTVSDPGFDRPVLVGIQVYLPDDTPRLYPAYRVWVLQHQRWLPLPAHHLIWRDALYLAPVVNVSTIGREVPPA